MFQDHHKLSTFKQALAASLALAVGGVAPSSLAAQAGTGSSSVSCAFCKDHGFKDCKKHKKNELQWEKTVLFCSVGGTCAACEGTYQIDCKHCEKEAVASSAATRRDLVRKWLADRQEKVGQYTKSKKILHGKTKHVEVTFSIAPMKVGKLRRKRSTHELMHIWLDRLEALYADFVKTLELTEADFAVPISLYMFKNEVDHIEICPRKVGMGSGSGSGRKYMGERMVFSMYQMSNEQRNDEDLNRYMVHHVTHLLVNHMKPHTWIFNRKHGWIDAGLAHWFEWKWSGQCLNFCYSESPMDSGGGYKGGKWKSAIRRLLEARKLPPFSGLYQIDTERLSLPAHALSFAYVDYLISEFGGAKMRDLVRTIKTEVPTREALQKIYGLTPITIGKKFEAWVRKNYPMKPKRGRR